MSESCAKLHGKREENNKEAGGEEKGEIARSYRRNTADEDRRGNKAAAVIYPIQRSGVG